MKKLRSKTVNVRNCNSCKLNRWCGGGCLAMDSELFCGFMKGIVEAFERDENFRKIYLPSSKS